MEDTTKEAINSRLVCNKDVKLEPNPNEATRICQKEKLWLVCNTELKLEPKSPNPNETTLICQEEELLLEEPNKTSTAEISLLLAKFPDNVIKALEKCCSSKEVLKYTQDEPQEVFKYIQEPLKAKLSALINEINLNDIKDSLQELEDISLAQSFEKSNTNWESNLGKVDVDDILLKSKILEYRESSVRNAQICKELMDKIQSKRSRVQGLLEELKKL